MSAVRTGYSETLLHRIFENLVEWCLSYVTTVCINCAFYLASDEIIVCGVPEGIAEAVVSLFREASLVFSQRNSSGYPFYRTRSNRVPLEDK